MRAISQYGAFGTVLIHGITRRGMDSTGTVVEYTDKDSIHAQFVRGGLTEWEQIEALEHFDFSGLPEGVNPLTRVSVYDTEAAVAHIANAKERIALQEQLDDRLAHFAKLNPSQVRIVEKPPVPKPWPSYDTDSIEKVLEIREATSFSPEKIRLYEMERPKPRTTLIAQMAELEREAAGEEKITVEI